MRGWEAQSCFLAAIAAAMSCLSCFIPIESG
jgi:hypothetical protein